MPVRMMSSEPAQPLPLLVCTVRLADRGSGRGEASSLSLEYLHDMYSTAAFVLPIFLIMSNVERYALIDLLQL